MKSTPNVSSSSSSVSVTPTSPMDPTDSCNVWMGWGRKVLRVSLWRFLVSSGRPPQRVRGSAVSGTSTNGKRNRKTGVGAQMKIPKQPILSHLRIFSTIIILIRCGPIVVCLNGWRWQNVSRLWALCAFDCQKHALLTPRKFTKVRLWSWNMKRLEMLLASYRRKDRIDVFRNCQESISVVQSLTFSVFYRLRLSFPSALGSHTGVPNTFTKSTFPVGAAGQNLVEMSAIL